MNCGDITGAGSLEGRVVVGSSVAVAVDVAPVDCIRLAGVVERLGYRLAGKH